MGCEVCERVKRPIQDFPTVNRTQSVGSEISVRVSEAGEHVEVVVALATNVASAPGQGRLATIQN